MAPQATSQGLRVATWNTNRRGPSILRALDDCRDRLDIATLQEVTLDQDNAFRDRLAAMGLNHVIYSGDPGTQKKQYGNIIASRWPLESINWKRLKQKIPWPQLIAHANIELGCRQIHVITAHVPNGSRNGWEKIDTCRALTEIVREVRGRPCILTGDFNEPRYALQDDRIVTFGQYQGRDGRYVYRRRRSFEGRSGTGEEWDAAVRWFFEKRDEHALRSAFWDARGRRTLEETHRAHGSPRWFDHVFVSDDIQVTSCDYLHTVRRRRLSDHSALVVQLAVLDNIA